MIHHVGIDKRSRAPPCDCLPIAKFAAREERASKAGVDDRVSSVYNLRASMNVERSRVYAYFMFVVEAMLRYVTFRLSSRDVSSQAFPVFNVSRPRTIKRSQVKRRNGEGLEPRLRLGLTRLARSRSPISWNYVN